MHVIAACHAVQDKAAMQQNLQQLARGAQWLVLWLDCDREGENIGFEVSHKDAVVQGKAGGGTLGCAVLHTEPF
jgi:DNA topoisomerase IA